MEEEEPKEEYKFYAGRAPTARSSCKKCKQKIETKTLRMAKTGANPFGSGAMKMWHHLDCMFLVFSKQRATTAKIESPDDIGGWDLLSKEDQEEILKRLPESARSRRKPGTGGLNTTVPEEAPAKPVGARTDVKDDSLKQFRKLCADVSQESSYLGKTSIVKKFITTGSDGVSYKGNLLLLIKLLLPGVVKRVYNLQSRQIAKLFSRLFNADYDEMLKHLEEGGDVAETIGIFFENSKKISPAKKSTLSIHDVDKFLETLKLLTKEQEQMEHFDEILPLCTVNDLRIIIRLVKHDLRINSGAKHILDAVHEDAYSAFQASRDLNSVLLEAKGNQSSVGTSKRMNVEIKLLIPVLPMLAQPCRNIGEAFKKCPNGIYSEVKYDGERVQVHKEGNDFKFFSRSLKPVLPHKVEPLRKYIPLAFPHGNDLILDCEILMVDAVTSQPLPFGSLGKHKKNDFKDATVCLFVFDCIYYNGESLLNKPLIERKKILKENMTEIPNHTVFSKMEEIRDPKHLEEMINDAMRLGLEGLVLKDKKGIYEPGKRHWLKVKKDYLQSGTLADSVDLVVLGAWYGTGQKGGMMSIFLMGCYDETRDIWLTVTKVHSGHDDQTLEALQTELDMIKISKDIRKVPPWLRCTKTMVPDFVARDPKKQPVWKIVGAEFTKHEVHTADGISIRFPRVDIIRTDKDWESANNLAELRIIYEKSKQTSDITINLVTENDDFSNKKLKATPRKNTPQKTSINVTPRGSESLNQNFGKLFENNKSPQRKRKLNFEDASEHSVPMKIKHPLPDVFVGVKLRLPDSIQPKERLKFERFFIAYGGELLGSNEENEATHTFTRTDGKKYVDIDWLYKSIMTETLQCCN